MAPPVPVYIIGSGRSGTHFFHELLSSEPAIAASHELHPMAEAFERYVEWNELPVDHGAFLAMQRAEIARARDRGLRFVEASSYLSLSVRRLHESFAARFVLVVRDPVSVVTSLLHKGWYADRLVRVDPSCAAGYHELGQPHHGFSRLAPRGAEAVRWERLTQVGRLAWYWRTIHERALEAFEHLPAADRMVVRIEDVDHARYMDIVRFCGEEPTLTSAGFERIARARPGGLPALPEPAWTATESAELRDEIGDLGTALGYDASARPRRAARPVVPPRARGPQLEPRTLIATIGPRNWDAEHIDWMVSRGVRHFRVNLARHSFERNRELILHVAALPVEPRPVVFVDLPGAKMRLGRFMASPVQELEAGRRVRLVHAEDQPAPDALAVSTPEFFERASRSALVTFSGSPVVLAITDASELEVIADVLIGGAITKFSGVWLSGPYRPYEKLWANDRRLLGLVRDLPVDFVAVSFADSADVIHEARALAGDDLRVVAKVESACGIAAWDELLIAADAVMVGRDDLSRHMPLPHIRRWLRHTHRDAIMRSTPVIAASHYLASLATAGEVRPDELDEVREVIARGFALCLADSGASDHWRDLVATAGDLIAGMHG